MQNFPDFRGDFYSHSIINRLLKATWIQGFLQYFNLDTVKVTDKTKSMWIIGYQAKA